MAQEGFFLWDSNNETPAYSRWFTPQSREREQSRGEKDEDCVQMVRQGTWNDLTCDTDIAVMCEKIFRCESTSTTTTTTTVTTTTVTTTTTITRIPPGSK